MSGAAGCPKCGRSRDEGAEACARCGLVFARWPGPGAATAAAAPLGAELERSWAALAATWGDEAAHEAFVKQCAAAGRLAAAGHRYRSHLDRHPGDPAATRMQARIVGMAAAVMVPAPRAAAPVHRARWFWWVVLACALGGGLAGVFFRTLGR